MIRPRSGRTSATNQALRIAQGLVIRLACRAHRVQFAWLPLLAALISLLVGCGKESMVAASISVSSPAFSSGGAIPAKYTCSGADVSPALSWTGTPGGAHSLVLTVIDPDAPGKPFVHWVIFNLPPASSDLSEGAAPPRGGVQGRNDFGSNGYGGPCPPPGPAHHYHFKIYALDTMTSLPEGASNSSLQEAINGHVLATGEIVGTFKR